MSNLKQSRTFSAPMHTNLPSNENAKTSDAFERAKSDMEAVFQEGSQLESDGKLDEQAAKRIESKLQTISDRLDQQVANDIAAIRPGSAIQPQSAWKKIVAFLFLLAFIGMPLEFTVGESFVFSYSNGYKSAIPTLFALTLPAFAILWFRLEKQQLALSYRSPTWAVRWLIVFPLVVVLSSSLVVLSPFGWSALGGWAIGSEAQPQLAKVLSVGPERARAGKCDQKAMLDIDGIQTNICIEGKVVGPALKTGNTVSVRGRSSFLGLFIEEVRVTHWN
jgi:hypothetical protein